MQQSLKASPFSRLGFYLQQLEHCNLMCGSETFLRLIQKTLQDAAAPQLLVRLVLVIPQGTSTFWSSSFSLSLYGSLPGGLVRPCSSDILFVMKSYGLNA